MFGAELVFAIFEFGHADMVDRQPRQSALHADEFAQRFTMLVQPVRVAKPNVVRMRLFKDVLKETFGMNHKEGFRMHGDPFSCKKASYQLQPFLRLFHER